MKHTLTFEGTSIIVEEPDGWDRSVAFILGHGAGQSMDSPFMSFFHNGLAGLGFLSVKFNFQYMEQGRRAPDHQKKLRATYRGVIDMILERYEPEALLIGGKSMGGRVASSIAGEISAVRGLVFLGYPLHPPGRTDKLRDEHLYELDRGMLFVSGTRDSLARQELLDRVIAKIGERARLVWIEGGDHSLRVKKSDKDSLAALFNRSKSGPDVFDKENQQVAENRTGSRMRGDRRQKAACGGTLQGRAQGSSGLRREERGGAMLFHRDRRPTKPGARPPLRPTGYDGIGPSATLLLQDR